MYPNLMPEGPDCSSTDSTRHMLLNLMPEGPDCSSTDSTRHMLLNFLIQHKPP